MNEARKKRVVWIDNKVLIKKLNEHKCSTCEDQLVSAHQKPCLVCVWKGMWRKRITKKGEKRRLKL